MERWLAFALGVLILPTAAGADRIRLKNGKSFDDVVVVESTQTTIRFRLASGEMSLPAEWVERVDKENGALAQYLDRRSALLANAADTAKTATSAQAWLDLARWARVRGVAHGFREALIAAAEMDPRLDGLAPLMAVIDYSLDPDLGVWVEGFPASRLRQGVRPQAAPSAEYRSGATGGQERVAEGLARAIETLAEAELERTRSRAQRTIEPPALRRTVYAPAYSIAAIPFGFVGSGWVFSGAPLRPSGSDPKNPVIRKPRNSQARALLSRPPGSLLPVSAYRD